MIESPKSFQIIYGFLILISINSLFFISLIKKELIKFPLTFSIIGLLSLVIGARGTGVGLDSKEYAAFFVIGSDKIDEPMFHLIKLMSLHNITAAFIITSLATNIILLLAFRKFGKRYPLYIALYLCTFLFINMNVNIVRQGLAMAIFSYAAAALLDYSYRKYWLIGIIAIITHFSAAIPVFSLAIIVLYEKRGARSAFIPLMILCAILYFVNLSNILAPFASYSELLNKVYWYLTWNIGKAWKFKHIYFLILFLIVALLIANRVFFLNFLGQRRNHLALMSIICGFLLVFIFRQEEMFADRIFYYFIFFIPILIYSLAERSKFRMVALVLLVIGLNIWYMKSIVIQYPNWFIPPYESIRF